MDYSMHPVESWFEYGEPWVSKDYVFMSDVGDKEVYVSANAFCLHI